MTEDEKKRPRPLLDARALLDLSDPGEPPPPVPTQVERTPPSIAPPAPAPLPRGASEMLPFEPLSTASIFAGRSAEPGGVTTTRSMEVVSAPASARPSQVPRAVALLVAVLLTCALGIAAGSALAPRAAPPSPAPPASGAAPRIVAQVASAPPPEAPPSEAPTEAPSEAPSEAPTEPSPPPEPIARPAPRRALPRRGAPAPTAAGPDKAELAEQLRITLEASVLDWTDLSALDDGVVRRWNAAERSELGAAYQAVDALIGRASASPAVIAARLGRVLARLQALPAADPRRVPLEDQYLELKSMLETHPSPERARRLRQRIRSLEATLSR